MMNGRSVFAWLVFFMVGFGGQAANFTDSPFVPSWEREEIRLKPGDSVQREIRLRVPPGHYLYREKTDIEFIALDGVNVSAILYPPAVPHADPYLGKTAEIYTEDVAIAVTLQAPASLAPGHYDLQGVLRYQGCSDKLCFRPEEVLLSWPIEVVAAEPAAGNDAAPSLGFWDLLSHADFAAILTHSYGLALIMALLGGMITSFTPCVLPLLPVIFLVMGMKPRAFKRNLALAATFTAGMVLTYATLGTVAAAAGLKLGFLFQRRIFLVMVSLFFALMALAMAGVITLQVPQWVRQKVQTLGGHGMKGAFLAGLSIGFLAAPCVGPVIGGLLVYIISTQNLLTGFSLLVAFGGGMGLVFMLLGTFYGVIRTKWSNGRFFTVIKIILGVALLFPAYYYGKAALRPSAPPASALDVPDERGWIRNMEAGLTRAQRETKPIVIDFYADWCPPCQLMDRTTFNDAKVIAKLGAVVAIRVDATHASVALDAILERFNVVGWPTILFLAPDGTPYADLTQVGDVVNATEMLKLLDDALLRAGRTVP